MMAGGLIKDQALSRTTAWTTWIRKAPGLLMCKESGDD